MTEQEEWMRRLRMRVERLQRLLELKAPENVVLNEIGLVEQAITRVRAIVGTANDNVQR
jgi:hypothetical protein